MPSTSPDSLRYPVDSDSPDIPRDVKALADDVQAALLKRGSGIPVGSVVAFAATNPPSGWLLCDSTIIPRAAPYDALFAVIQTTYNTGGEAADSFRLPDLRMRMPVGFFDGWGGTNVLGKMAGSPEHTLTVEQMPAHAHGVYDPGHAHGVADPTHGHMQTVTNNGTASSPGTFARRDYNSDGNSLRYRQEAGTEGSYASIGIYGSGTGIGIYNTGSSWPHPIMQPYIVMNYIIKY